MIDCLDNFVGLSYCDGQPASGSGQYINSLPGMRVQRIDMIADEEQITFKGVWTDVQEAASARFFTDIQMELSKCYQLNPYCDYEDLICQNKSKLVNAWKFLLGNQMMLENYYSNRINRYTTIQKEEAKELMAFYQVEYEKAIEQAAKLMNVASCELCCEGNPAQISWLP